MRLPPQTRCLAYGAALGLTVLATAVAELFRSIFEGAPFLPFITAVVLSAWIGGFWPGLASTVLGAVAANYLLMPPYRELSITGAGDVVRLGMFVLVSVIISGACAIMHAHRRTAEAHARDLQFSEERYRRIVETAHEGIWNRDAEGRISYVNPRMAQLLGYAATELLGRPWWDFLHEQDRPAAHHSWERRRRGITERFEFRFRCKDGSDLWAIVSTTPFFDEQGVFLGALGLMTDITQRKQAEEMLRRANEELEARVAERTAQIQKTNAQLQVELTEHQRIAEELRASQARFAGILAIAEDAIISVDRDQRIVLFNQGAEKIFRYKASEVLGQPLDLLLPARFVDLHRQHIAAFAQTGAGARRMADRRQVFGRRRDGTEFPAEASISKLELPGETTFTAMLRDVTERKRTEEDLQQARTAAEAANRAKSVFLANVSHEIRNPMQIILTMTDLLTAPEVTPQQGEYLHMLKSAASSLLAVLNDLLDFSKIEAGKLDLEKVPFNLDSCLGEVLKAQALRAHPKGLELACVLAPVVPEVVVGDPNRLGQILTNLVGNAIKFTAQGEVVMRIDVASQALEEVELQVAVTDTGVGIPADKLETIFQPFEQADTSTTRKFGGTGLGLSIASRLVALMGGRIWVESRVGRGSSFYFTARFGLTQSTAAGLVQVRLAGLRDVRVLVVDHHATARNLLVEILRDWHLHPAGVEGGPAALRALDQADAAGRPFAAVLCETRLPDTDTFALATQIRRRPTAPAVIAILSTSASAGEMTRWREQGVAASLTKPLLPSELRAALLTVLGRQPVATESGKRDLTPTVLGPLRILVTEDNVITQVLMVDVLEKLGHTVLTASSGREALAALARQSFDVILMDVEMPEMNGFEVTARIREREQETGQHIPIIAVTAHAMTGDRERCLHAGMDGYLAKPLQAPALVEALAQFVPAAAFSSR